jgi:hypothetical protein
VRARIFNAACARLGGLDVPKLGFALTTKFPALTLMPPEPSNCT